MQDSLEESASRSEAEPGPEQPRLGIYLIGYEEDDIRGRGLPTNGQMLRFFFYNHNRLRRTIRVSARCAVRRCMELWAGTGIPTTEEADSVAKLEGLFREWRELKEAPPRDTDHQLIREFTFEEKLRQLFNVAAGNALERPAEASPGGRKLREHLDKECVAAVLGRVAAKSKAVFKKQRKPLGKARPSRQGAARHPLRKEILTQ